MEEFWNEKLEEYREALAAEQAMDVINDDMIKYLKFSIQECLNQLS